MISKFISKKYFFIIFILFILFLISSISSKNNNSNNIAIVNIDGVILESDKVVKALDLFNKDDNVKAIILRINSPGGSVAPSQEIYEKVKRIKNDKIKPIITSVDNMAASGGYYIAIGSDLIIANYGSIIGSIGVIMSYPIAKNLLDNLGIDFNTYKSGEYKDSGSPYRYNTENDDKYFNEVVDDLHKQFMSEVSIQRNIPLGQLKEYSQGQIFTGNKAIKIGLVDTIGTFEDALNISKNLANISGETNLIYPKVDRGNLLKILLEETKSWVDFFNEIPMYIYK